jgi:hypothetical protein
LINFFFPCHPWHHYFLGGTPAYPSNLPTALLPTNPPTSLTILTPLLCLRTPPSPTLENQWDQGLGLEGFESPKLERSEEKEWEELECRGGKNFVECEEKPQLQSKRLSVLFFHCVIIAYCFASIATWKKDNDTQTFLCCVF